MTKTILCLTNSRKLSGRCIAGRNITPDGFTGWMRPVSARLSTEISEEERRYENGSDPRVLDIIAVPVLTPDPCLHQTENWVIDDRRYWEKKGEASWADVAALVQKPASLWTIGDSTVNGVNDRIPLETASEMRGSLLLVEPEYLQVHVGVGGDPKRRIRASFLYNETHYSLVVTDPVVERAFLAKPNGSYALEQILLCLSLTENWEGWCYKVVAAMLERPI